MDQTNHKARVNVVKTNTTLVQGNPLLSNKGMPKKETPEVSTRINAQTKRDSGIEYLKIDSKILESQSRFLASINQEEALKLVNYSTVNTGEGSLHTDLNSLKKLTLPNQSKQMTIKCDCYSTCSKCKNSIILKECHKEENAEDDNLLSCIDDKTYRESILAHAADDISVSYVDSHFDSSEMSDKYARDAKRYDKCIKINSCKNIGDRSRPNTLTYIAIAISKLRPSASSED